MHLDGRHDNLPESGTSMALMKLSCRSWMSMQWPGLGQSTFSFLCCVLLAFGPGSFNVQWSLDFRRRKRAAARRAAREAKHQTESVCLELEGQAEEEQEDQEPGLLVVLVCDKRLCWTGGKEGNKARQKNDLL